MTGPVLDVPDDPVAEEQAHHVGADNGYADHLRSPSGSGHGNGSIVPGGPTMAAAAATTSPTYFDVGATMMAEPLPAGFRHDRYEIALSGPDTRAFERGAEGLREWAAHRGAGFVVEPHHSPTEGSTVAVAAR